MKWTVGSSGMVWGKGNDYFKAESWLMDNGIIQTT